MKRSSILLLLLLTSSFVFAAFPVNTVEFISVLEPETTFHFGGFFLGFLLGIYGVVIAYLIGEKNVIKSAWWGFGVVAFITIALSVALIYSLSVNSGGQTYF